MLRAKQAVATSEFRISNIRRFSMAFNFSGKKILVTGASRGIGRGIALALAKAECTVYALARSKDLLDSLAAENANIVPIVQDLGKWDETRTTLEKLDALDGLVNNAAILQPLCPALEQSRESLTKYLDMNLLAAINCIQIIGKKMVDAGKKGSIVNMSSVYSLAAYPDYFGYSLCKAALDMVTKQFALELGPHGIRVNSVNPTLVLTELNKSLPEIDQVTADLETRAPLGRSAVVVEAVNPVLYLLSDYAAMVTGTAHLVDGGIMCNITTKQ